MRKCLVFPIACAALVGCAGAGAPQPGPAAALATPERDVIEIRFLPAEVVAANQVTTVSVEPEYRVEPTTNYCTERRVAGSRIVQQDCYITSAAAEDELQRYYIQSEINSALTDMNRRIMESAQGGALGAAANAVRDYR